MHTRLLGISILVSGCGKHTIKIYQIHPPRAWARLDGTNTQALLKMCKTVYRTNERKYSILNCTGVIVNDEMKLLFAYKCPQPYQANECRGIVRSVFNAVKNKINPGACMFSLRERDSRECWCSWGFGCYEWQYGSVRTRAVMTVRYLLGIEQTPPALDNQMVSNWEWTYEIRFCTSTPPNSWS